MSGDFAAWVAGMGPAVANHLWQSTACVAGAWLLTLALRRNQARVRHAVWVAASMKFLIPFSLLIAAGNLLPHPKQAVAPVVYSAMDIVEEPFTVDLPIRPVVHVPTLRERVEAAAPVGLFVIWVLGAGVVMFRWARGWRMVRRTLRDAEAVDEGREWEILRRVVGTTEGKADSSAFDAGAARCGMTRNNGPLLRALKGAATPDRGTMALRLSEERMEPGVFGMWRPVLVWPRQLSARLDDAHIEAIVAHELAHVRRRDNLTAALHMAVETVFWFHPLVWWMERRMAKEREQACDEAVLGLARFEGQGSELEEGARSEGAGVRSQGTASFALRAQDDRFDRFWLDPTHRYAMNGARIGGSAVPPERSWDGTPGEDSSTPPVPFHGTDGAPERSGTTPTSQNRDPFDSAGRPRSGQVVGHSATYAEVYAEALLKTCRFCIESPLMCVAGVTGADLKQRVVEIVTGRALRRMSWAKKALVAAAAVCVVAMPVMLGQAESARAAQRLMLAAMKVAPRPVQNAAKAMMAVVDTPGTGEIAEAQNSSPSEADASTGRFEFAVATIKPHNPGGVCTGRDTADGFAASCQGARSLIMSAYELAHQQQVVGLPAWAANEGFDVVAKMDDDTAAALARMTPQQQREERPAMLRSLLAQRFGLKIHRETRQLPIYVMKVTTPGKLKLSDPKMRGHGTFSNDKFSMVAMPISNLVNNLGNIVGRMVIDQTGLTETYDLTLEWAPQGADASDPRPSIFAALEEQLGLKLVPAKGPVEVIVIDHIEKPTLDGAEVAPEDGADSGVQLNAEYRKLLDEDAHWLITPQERAEFLRLATDKDRDAFMASFWERRNPPGAAKGAYRHEIYSRIGYANGNFAAGAKPGWATDRGRAYIVYGRPDRVESHPANNAPSEIWHYSTLAGIGNDVTLRFERTANGDYQLSGAWPQASAAYVPTMTFDVVSVRETKRDSPNGWFRVSGGFTPLNSSHMTLENNGFGNLIDEAYSVEFERIEGVPRELSWKTFNIEAKGDAAMDERLAKLPKEQVHLEQQHMMQVMLAERFHLRVHWETRDAPTYDLVVSKSGRLHTTGDAPSAEMVKAFGDRPIPPVLQQGSSIRGFEYMGYGASAGDIAEMMMEQFGRPVYDRTGLTGKYYFHLKTWQVRASDRKDDETNPWPPLETAVQDDLGLKLVPSHGPVRYLVVDHIEMPTEN